MSTAVRSLRKLSRTRGSSFKKRQMVRQCSRLTWIVVSSRKRNASTTASANAARSTISAGWASISSLNQRSRDQAFSSRRATFIPSTLLTGAEASDASGDSLAMAAASAASLEAGCASPESGSVGLSVTGLGLVPDCLNAGLGGNGVERSHGRLPFGKAIVLGGDDPLFAGHRLVLDYLVLQLQDAVIERLWGRRASRNVDVHGDDLIDPLHHGVRVIGTADVGARPHRDHPFRFGHLIVQGAYHGGHLLGHCARDEHHVRLSRRGAIEHAEADRK